MKSLPAIAGIIGGLLLIFGGGSGGILPGPGGDVLSEAYEADRASQVAVLRELASQPFDGATIEGREKAGQWFNANRFRNRANDFGAYTDAVSEAIAANSEEVLARQLEK